MANYNPHAPHILGQEWVPIRQANYSPDDNVTERGYTMRIEHAVVPVTGAYYVESVPANRLSQVCDFMAVYPAGRETLTGPIKRLYIPASAVAVTGPSIDISSGFAALHSPTDATNIFFNAPGNSNDLQVSFDTASYAQQLFGKRILDVSIRYVFTGDPAEGQNLRFNVTQPDVATDTVQYAASLVVATATTAFDLIKPRYEAVSLTDLNPFWDTGVAVNQQRNILPWRFQELNLFRSGAAAGDRLVVVVDNRTIESSLALWFMDMQVTYCEETRVRYGGRRTGNQNALSGIFIADDYALGQNLVRLYDTSFVNTASLAAGDYTVTLKHVNLNPFTALDGEPTIYAARPYYDLPRPTPVRINTTLTTDEQFTLGDETVLTQLTLHTASSIVTGSHPYGARYGAPVYGTITAIQEIEDDPVGTARTYPQVRFYARRYGNTTIPLTLTDVATGLSTVSITPAEFDALEEIVDGWREVTLRFATPPSFATAAGDVDWRWSATGELAGNQWQVLVADGPGTSVTTPPSLAAALATGKATYYAPQGDTVTLTWQAPTISGTGEDSTSDAVLIFSEDPPTVTGFTVVGSGCSVAVTGIGTECDLPNACLPTAIYGNQLSWDTGAVFDLYDRIESGIWGTSTSGDTWAAIIGAGGSIAVDGETGTSTTVAANNTNHMWVTAPGADVVQYFEATTPATATGAVQVIESQFRVTDLSNMYAMQVLPDTNGLLLIRLRRVVAGVGTTIGPSVATIPYTPGEKIKILTQIIGSSLQGKVWTGDQPKPDAWTVEAIDTSFASGPSMGIRLGVAAGNTNVPITFSVDNYCANATNLAGASVELQRRDSMDTEWKTIMLSSTACVAEFCDFEARVGIESEYRIRICNVLDFCGPWVTGAGTIAAPGVAVAGDGNSILIFTSNAAPDSSLAYVMQWENEPIETFAFPEANFVDLQRIFGRDYFTAFYPLERGGDQFTRTLLVNAGAVTPTALANFKDLRDLAWAQLDYVCVRDELGNRWLANIRVPDGAVRRNRRLYLAQIQVAQLTDTPSPVDPGA